MAAATSVYTNLDVVMLRFMQGNTEVGYYNAAIKVKTILVTLITSLGTVLLPRLSYYIKKEKTEDFYRMIGKAVNFVVVAGLPLTIYFMLYASDSVSCRRRVSGRGTSDDYSDADSTFDRYV